MGRSSSQTGSSNKRPIYEPSDFVDNTSILSKTVSLESITNNQILLKLEEDGFTTPDEKAKELLMRLTDTEALYALRLLFENLQNKFSSQILVDSLEHFANPSLFNHHSKETITRLEFHLRAWSAALEQICFSQIVLCKELRDKIYNSIAKFAEYHRKNIQVIEEGFDSLRPTFNPSNQRRVYNDKNFIKRRNYNIDFLLIHLRDTLHSLRDDETWFQEVLRRTKELLKSALNITPGLLSILAPAVIIPFDNCATFVQLRQGLSFKYPIAPYYLDWRIMSIIQYNLFNWSESNEKIINKKFGERILMEYLWSFSEREWNDNVDKAMLNSQNKFDEILNKLARSLKNTGGFISDMVGNEPLALPDMLWFGMLDLAQNLIQKSSQPVIHGFCYYLAIESLNKAPSSFIQFKAIEVLLHLQNINEESFSMMELDFNQYAQNLYENNSTESSEKFQCLLSFVKEKCHEDFKLLNDKIGKGKGKNLYQNINFKKEQTLNSCNILDIIADEMTCPISHEPEDQLCILKCQHVISLNNLKRLKQRECPICRESIDYYDVRSLSQSTIFKNLYSYLFDAGRILHSYEADDPDQIDQAANDHYESESDDSEADYMIIKKKFIKEFKMRTNRFQSIFQITNSKKQYPEYKNVIKELDDKNYERAVVKCRDYLKVFPKSYTMRCVIAYAYRCLKKYEQANSYLDEAIELKKKSPIAYYICGEILFSQREYINAILKLNIAKDYKIKTNNLNILLGTSYYFEAGRYKNHYYYDEALKNYKIALMNEPKHYLCLKSCAHIYKIQERYLEALEMLDKILEINQDDSLILCYYGEILNYLGRYKDSIYHFTRAYNIDPENSHILINKAIIHYELQEYNKALLDINKSIHLISSNSFAYFFKGLIYYALGNHYSARIEVERCKSFFDANDNLAKFLIDYLKHLLSINESSTLNHRDISLVYLVQEYSNSKLWTFLLKYFKVNDDYFSEIGIINKFHKLMYKEKGVYFTSNLTNLNKEFLRFQESDSNSLSNQVLSFKDEVLPVILPKLFDNVIRFFLYYVTWKINVKKLLSKDCYVEFIVEIIDIYSNLTKCHKLTLTYENLSELIGLGWIEYTLPFEVNKWAQPSIILKDNSIIMQVDYVRLMPNKRDTVYVPKMNEPLPINKFYPNVPEAFNDKYFSKKEMETLIELKDIIN